MEESKVRELINEAIESRGKELESIEINGSKGNGRAIIRWTRTVEAFVVAYSRANPGLSDVEGIRGDSALEALDYWIY